MTDVGAQIRNIILTSQREMGMGVTYEAVGHVVAGFFLFYNEIRLNGKLLFFSNSFVAEEIAKGDMKATLDGTFMKYHFSNICPIDYMYKGSPRLQQIMAVARRLGFEFKISSLTLKDINQMVIRTLTPQ